MPMGGDSTTTSFTPVPKDIKNLRKGLSSQFSSMLGPDMLWRSPGILGDIQQNLLSQDLGQDYLGAKKAITDTISGEGWGPMFSQIQSQLAPSFESQLQKSMSQLSSGAGRGAYSSGFLNRAGRLASDNSMNMMNLTSQLTESGLGRRMQAAGNLYDTIMSRNPSNFLSTIAQFVSGYQPIASGQSSKLGPMSMLGGLTGAFGNLFSPMKLW